VTESRGYFLPGFCDVDTFYPICRLGVQDLHNWFCISLLPYLF